MIGTYAPMLLMMVLAMAVAGLFFTGTSFLGGKVNETPEKLKPFERNAESSGGRQLKLSVKFYLTAILFVVYPWAIQFKKLGWVGLGSMFGFLAAACGRQLVVDDDVPTYASEAGVAPPGNGGDAGEGDAGGGDAGGERCPGDIACERMVFVTSQVFSGDLGGIAGADDKCAEAAKNSSRKDVQARSFVAWINASNAPVSRLKQGTMPYRRVDGQEIAADWGVLASGKIKVPIEVDENGVAQPVNLTTAFVWTGSELDGTVSTNTCRDWSNGSDASGAYGKLNNLMGRSWMSVTSAGCDTSRRLYCFER